MAIPSELREIGETRHLKILATELAAIVRDHVQQKTGIDIGPITLHAHWDADNEHYVLTGAPELDEEDARRDVLAKAFTNDYDADMGTLVLTVLGDILGVKQSHTNSGPYLNDVDDDILKDGPWLFFVVETETPPPWDPHRVERPRTTRECPQCGTASETPYHIYGHTIHCLGCGYTGAAKRPPAKPLTDVLRRLFDSGTTEGATVADMLQTIASNDDPDMQTPEHLVACLEELIDWARTARSDLQPDS